MSTVQLDIWHLVTLLIMFVTVIAGAGRMLLAQLDKRLDTRFDGLDASRNESTRHWDHKFAQVMEDQQRGTEAWRNLERDFLKFRGDLPLEYVRREDFIRNQSVIEAKLDAVALHIQNLQLQRINKNG